jgi:hypothetical protein
LRGFDALDLHTEPLIRGTIGMMVPGMPQLLKDIKVIEDYARACQSWEEIRMVLLTREEEDVIESFRQFKAQDDD